MPAMWNKSNLLIEHWKLSGSKEFLLDILLSIYIINYKYYTHILLLHIIHIHLWFIKTVQTELLIFNWCFPDVCLVVENYWWHCCKAADIVWHMPRVAYAHDLKVCSTCTAWISGNVILLVEPSFWNNWFGCTMFDAFFFSRQLNQDFTVRFAQIIPIHIIQWPDSIYIQVSSCHPLIFVHGQPLQYIFEECD